MKIAGGMLDEVAPGDLSAAANLGIADEDSTTSDSGEECSKSWDEGEDSHGLEVCGRDRNSLRERKTVESARKE